MKKLLSKAANSVISFTLGIAVALTSGAVMAATTSLIGDLNLDGKVNPMDLAILARHLANWEGYEALPYGAEDEPGDEPVMPEVPAEGFAVVNEFVDFDLAEIYLDLYVDGELQEDALVTALDGFVLAELSDYKFSMLLSNEDYFYPGTVYAYSQADGEYNLKEIINDNNYYDYDLIDAKVAGFNNVITFDDGSTVGDRSTRIRTSGDTVFYFIKNTEDCNCTPVNGEHETDCDSIDPERTSVDIYVGQPDEAEITFDDNTTIWVDKLGHGTADTNGHASVVFVKNYVDTNGFFNIGTYVFAKCSNATVVVDTAENLGLPSEYTGTYYMYADSAINLDDGSKMTLYSKYKLGSFRIYKVNADGVVYLVDSLGYKGGILRDDGSHYSQTHWIAGSQVVTYRDTKRDYARYGIIEIDGKDAGGVKSPNINDYKAYLNLNAKELEAQLAKAATELGVDVESFEEIPDDIRDIALQKELIYAEYVDDYVVIDLVDGENTTALVTENNRVTDIIVIDNNNNNTYTGEEAVELLNAAPTVAWIGNKKSEKHIQLFEEYIDDGSIVFIINYTQNDK